MNRRLFNLLIVMFLSFFLITNVYADDYSDDIYDGDYSLQEMLENYNVITFGMKDLDSNMHSRLGASGNARLFHINSKFLVNGNVNILRFDFWGNSNDLKSYADSVSSQDSRFIFCGYRAPYSFNYLNCGIADSYNLSNVLYTDGLSYFYINGYMSNLNSSDISSVDYINFNRLYDNVVDDQKRIKKGKKVTVENRIANITIGGEYYIDDVNEIDKIMFDNFAENEDKLTIITINNTGSIYFPKIYESTNNGEGNLVSSNDYIGMERPNDYYASNYVLDKYYGNIIWNVPNASYIELPSAPFIGHIVAPSADLYGPELHYAGAFLVNSLYLEGKSEAHYYPLSNTISYKSNPELVKAITKSSQGSILFNNNVNPEELEEGIVVSFSVEPEDNYVLKNIEIKDEEDNSVPYTEIKTLEYEFTMPKTNVTITPTFQQRNIKDIITNPKTGNILLFIIFMISLFIGISLFKKKESTKI